MFQRYSSTLPLSVVRGIKSPAAISGGNSGEAGLCLNTLNFKLSFAKGESNRKQLHATYHSYLAMEGAYDN